MNLLLQIVFIILFIEPLKGNIDYSNKCKFCKHFVRPFMKEGVYIGDYFGKCRKFLKINYGTNELNYEYAIFSRAREVECGLKGRYFEASNTTNNYEYHLE